MFPCAKCGDGNSQIVTLAKYVQSNGVKFGRLWYLIIIILFLYISIFLSLLIIKFNLINNRLDVESSDWGSTSANQQFFNELTNGTSDLSKKKKKNNIILLLI